MSIEVMTAAWKVPCSATEKLVLLALADWANGEGVCWPSLQQLADKSGLSRRGLLGAIARLTEAGHLSRETRVGKGTVYRVHPCTTCTRAPDAPVHDVHQTRARGAPNTSRNTIRKKATLSPKGAGARADDAAGAEPAEDGAAGVPARAAGGGRRGVQRITVPDWVPAEAWAGFCEMRSRMRKPMSARAAELIFARLRRFEAEHGWPPGAVLDQSVERGWAGVFPLKSEHGGGFDGRTGGSGRSGGQRASASDFLQRWVGACEAEEAGAGSDGAGGLDDELELSDQR